MTGGNHIDATIIVNAPINFVSLRKHILDPRCVGSIDIMRYLTHLVRWKLIFMLSRKRSQHSLWSYFDPISPSASSPISLFIKLSSMLYSFQSPLCMEPLHVMLPSTLPHQNCDDSIWPSTWSVMICLYLSVHTNTRQQIHDITWLVNRFIGYASAVGAAFLNGHYLRFTKIPLRLSSLITFSYI